MLPVYSSSVRRICVGNLLAFGFCLGLATQGRAVEKAVVQEVVLRNWDSDDGLPSTRVNDIARTPDGYLWLATQRGLVRFDGTRFVTVNITNVPASKAQRATCLLVDKQGRLWVGFSGLLLHQSGRDFVTEHLETRTEGCPLNALAEDNQGDLWVATEGAGLIRVQQGRPEAFGVESGLPSLTVAQVLCDFDGRMWAVASGQLLTFEAGRWRTAEGMPAVIGTVQTIARTRAGGLWVVNTSADRNGKRDVRLCKLIGTRWTTELDPYPWPQDSQQYQGFSMLEDKKGRVWCATAGGIFYRKPAGSWQRLVSETPWSQIETLCLAEDEGGPLLVGTRTTGLLQVQDRPVMTFPLPASAVQNAVLTACVARDGSVWSGTDGSGIFRWHDGEITQYGVERGLSDLHVAVLLEDRHTNLWAGTLAGLFRRIGDRFEPAPGPLALREPTRALLEDRAGALWVGGQAGLVQIKTNDLEVFGRDDGLSVLPIRALAGDRDGRIWVGTGEGGLFRQEGRRFVRVPTPQRPVAWVVRALHCDAAGVLWIGTDYSGLLRLRDGHFDHWDWWRDGLPSNSLSAILEDADGNLWMSSENGIFGCSKPMLDACLAKPVRRLQPWRLTTADGLAHKVCSGIGQPAAAKSADGRLWFPDGPALAVFDPATISKAVRIWSPLVENVRVDGVAVPATSDGVRVQSGVRQIEFQYTSPNAVVPDRLRFRIRMEGLDKEWVDAGNRRDISYYRLPPGRYEFKVMVSGPEKDWLEGRGLSVEVVPRVWERHSIQLATGLILLATVAGVVWGVQRNRYHRRLERLEMQRKLEHERARIAKDIHDDLGASLTHITMLSESARSRLGDLPEAGMELDQIYGTARELTRSMEEVVWAVSPKHDTLDSLATYLGIYAQDFAAASRLRCRLDLPSRLSDRALNSQVRHNVFLAFKEALHNVAKHAAATEVRISLSHEERNFALTVEDNGHGFQNEIKAVAPASAGAWRAHLLSGNGLANMQSRLQEVGGRCEIQSQYGLGTCVRFVVPFVT